MSPKIKSIKEVFTDPNKIIDYSKENWSFLKFSVIIVIAGMCFGFNFFFSTFIIIVETPSMFWIVLGMCFLGVLLLDTFIYLYLFLDWIFIRIYLSTEEKRGKRVEKTESNVYVSRENIREHLKVISYCFLIPFLIYHAVVAILNLFLLSLKLTYVIVYISNFGPFLLYSWIIALTLYSIKDIEETQKFGISLIIVGTFLISYIIIIVYNFSAVVFLTNVLVEAYL